MTDNGMKFIFGCLVAGGAGTFLMALAWVSEWWHDRKDKKKPHHHGE
jgi:hypothetical protein